MDLDSDLASIILSRFNTNLEPASLSREELVDKIKGAIYGQAIGDAIGIRTEFMEKEKAREMCEEGLYGYQGWERDRHRSMWEEGEWSDDTDQMLLVLLGYLENEEVRATDFAARLRDWMQNGITEIGKRATGSGYTVTSVTQKPMFLSHPHLAAMWTWLALGCNLAANGGVMRTSILGIIDYNDLSKVLRNSLEICRVTHIDPRCIASCVAVTTAISLMLQGYNLDLIKHISQDLSLISLTASLQYLERDISDLKSLQYQPLPDPRVTKVLNFLSKKFHSLSQEIHNECKESDLISYINLSTLESTSFDGETYGYTYLALAAGFHSLFHFSDFQEGILNVIRQGGDTDTNAAVAGALLGCKLGYSRIPFHLIQGLRRREWLDSKIACLTSKFPSV
jgi:ADP-ribosylglycohydrolase